MTTFHEFFRGAKIALDLDSIHSQWKLLTPSYDVNKWRLPLPVWAQRKYEQDGLEAWEQLREELKQGRSTPINIYIHIPFCEGKCGFCDSYSFNLPKRRFELISEYCKRLQNEMGLWSAQGNLSSRPISTIHLGGGTPTLLGEQDLLSLVDACRRYFSVSEATEWALESTVATLSPRMLTTLHQAGFRRIHLGVQSLEDRVRQLIGRRCAATQVVSTIETCLSLGWIVSVDLLCGLPEQTLVGFINGIRTLISLGVDGFSIYELLIYPQNQKWAEKHHLVNRNHLENYWMFLAGANLVEHKGYKKNLFNHWALPRDQNIYFTFPVRGEDCLAIGTIADGLFNNYHYRHPRFASYMRLIQDEFPGLEGGMRRTPYEESLYPLTISILSGTISPKCISHLQATPRDGGFSLVERWLLNGLVTGDNQGNLVLTPSGSWFTGNVIADLILLPVE